MKGRASKDDPIGRWRSTNMVNQIGAEINAQTAAKLAAAAPVKTQEEVLTDRADAVMRKGITTFLNMKRIKITPITYADACKMIYGILREDFKTMSHDELLVLVAFTYSLYATDQLRSELI